MTDTTTQPVRVRFAPSPTGMLHVGSARTALFNWLFARHMGGKFLLRIEDTDLERSTDEATHQVLASMKWLGLEADEPIVYQSQRADLHRAQLDRLLAEGKAYRCFCPKERLEELRAKSREAGTIFAYSREMLEPGEMAGYEAQGMPFVIRFHCPPGGVAVFDDMVYGRIEVENANIGDFVIARGDGSPLYNFTNVVDDLDMEITHIIRGEDHVSNTPKQVLLYEAFGAQPPRFAHLPMILGTDKQKLSKRHGATGVHEFDEKGILSAALVNFLALLGWAPAEAEFNEVMTLDELAAKFTLDRVNKSPAVFDHEKLLWMNGVHIRQMPVDELHTRVIPVLEARFGPRSGFRSLNPDVGDGDWLRGIIALAIERNRTLAEFADNLEYFFRAPEACDEKAAKKFLGTPEQVAALRESGRVLAEAWDAAAKPAPGEVAAWGAAMEAPLRAWADAKGIKFGNVAQPIRLAVTGRTATPPLFDVLWHLGRDETARRIAACASRTRL